MRRYFIPVNFATEGKVGNFNIRNLVETVAIEAVLAVVIIAVLPLGISATITVSIVVLGIFAVVGLRGINGLSLLQFAADFIDYRQTRRVYGEPKSADKIRREKRLMKKKNQIIKQQERARKKEEQAARVVDRREMKQIKKERDE